jgi:hypothetical protein
MGEKALAQIKNNVTGETINVRFNPKEYTFTKNAPWKEQNIHGLNVPGLEWTSGGPLILAVELFFDVYEMKGDDRDVRKFTNKIEDLTLVDGSVHHPPDCLFIWGKKLAFRCVLTHLKQRFTLFLEDGTPVRAVLDCVFTEYREHPDEDLKAEKRHSPDHTKRRVVKQGDTLSWIAGKEYGDPSKWRIIADANRIDNPMDLTTGQQLLIPPLY